MSIEEFFNSELNEWSRNIDFTWRTWGFYRTVYKKLQAKTQRSRCLSRVEHFQNQFIIQKRNMEELAQKVSIQKENLAAGIKKGSGLIDVDIPGDQHFLREAVQLSEKIFIELKHSFYRFLAKVL